MLRTTTRQGRPAPVDAAAPLPPRERASRRARRAPLASRAAVRAALSRPTANRPHRITRRLVETGSVDSLRGWLGVRPGEGRLVALAATTVFCVIALNVVTIGTATALVLGTHRASVLPPLYAVGAGLSILMTL